MRNLHRLIWLMLICFAFEKQVQGQEYPWSLQYITNMSTINPAYVGMWDKSGLMVSTRTNWVGIKGAPLFQHASYFTPVKNQRSGVGMEVQLLNTGLEKRIFLTGDYSYQVRMDFNHFLRFGMRVGVINFSNNLTDYQLYPDHKYDSEFAEDIWMYNMTTFGMGGVFFTRDYYISLSLPNVINNTFKVNANHYSSLHNFNTVYLAGSYVFSLGQEIRFRPNLLIIASANRPVYFDAAALIYLPSNLQLGLNLRSNGAVCLSAQYTFQNRMKIGYASEYALVQDIRKFQVGTYELLIGYEFNVNKRKYSRPNYF
ncbi:MAG: PorP/SprF family type IX secretion system membrane protein [Candidatus Saccharibacteria bacterium]